MTASTGRWHLLSLARYLSETRAKAIEPLDALAAIEHARWKLDQAQAEMVEAARSAGRSWGDVARALGISRQAARQRYGQPSEPPESDGWPFFETHR